MITVTATRAYVGHLTVYGVVTDSVPAVPVVAHVAPLHMVEIEV